MKLSSCISAERRNFKPVMSRDSAYIKILKLPIKFHV